MRDFRTWMLAAVLLACAAPPALAQTNAAGISHVQGVKIYVSDLERSARFYTEVLGMTAVRRHAENGTDINEIILSLSPAFEYGPDSRAWIVLKTGHALPADRASFGQIAVTSPDTAALATRAQSAGFRFTQHQNGIIVVTDPDGYEIEVLPTAPR